MVDMYSNYEARLKSPGKQFRPSPSRLRKSLLSHSPNSQGSGLNLTPRRERAVYSDRFIPSRSGTRLEAGFTLLEEASPNNKGANNANGNDAEGQANGTTTSK